MLSDLQTDNKVVGLKQSMKAIEKGIAIKAFIAEDADVTLKTNFMNSCNSNNIPIEYAKTVIELGDACEISVGAAVAVITQ